jgi:hypothetical protein
VRIKRTAVIIILPHTMVEMPRNASVESVVPEKKIATPARKMPIVKNATNQKNLATSHTRLKVNGKPG